MNSIKCLIVDDEPTAQRILEGYLSDLNRFELVGKCLNALTARQMLEEQKIDLMFLDLEMPKLKGLAFLKTLDNPPKVIVTTAHREYALEGYELDVLDYLLKPISFERFIKAVNRYKKENTDDRISYLPSSNFLYVKSERKTLKLMLSDISYIEGMNNYIKIHYQDQMHIVYSSLNDIFEKLSDEFFRIHKSFIVNKNKITAFTQEHVEVVGQRLPIGNTYREVVKGF